MPYYRVRRTGEQIQNGTELYHHGILGQKWGVRRFQNKDGSLTRAGEKRYGIEGANSKDVKRQINDHKTNNVSSSNKSKKSIVEKWNSLDDKTKTAIKIGATAVGAAIVAYGAYSLYSNRVSNNSALDLEKLGIATFSPDTFNSIDDQPVKFIKPDFKSVREVTLESAMTIDPHATKTMLSILYDDEIPEVTKNVPLKILDPKTIKRFSPEQSTSEALQKSINTPFLKALEKFTDVMPQYLDDDGDPDYTKMPPSLLGAVLTAVGPERTNNCMYCTTAYELGRRGYAVKANGRPTGGVPEMLLDMFKFSDPKAIFSYDTASNKMDDLMKTFSDYGDGARGNICVSFKGGGGHSMAWEVINGKVQIIDCQRGKRFKTEEQVREYLGSVKGHIQSFRTDNAELKWGEQLLKAIDYADE